MAGSGYAQKNSAAAGNWGTAASWSPSGVPTAGDVVNVNHVMNLNTGLSPINTITFNPGSSGSSGTALLNMSGGTLDVKGNVTFTSSNHNLNSGTIYVRSGATLTIGAVNLGGASVIVEAGGTLIVNGNINNNGSTIQVNGTLTVNGSYQGANSNANITGSGTFTTTGTMVSMNGGAIFGNPNVNCGGPCNGNNICGRTATATPASSTICSGATQTLTAAISSGTPSAYQWESSTSINGTYTNIGGATSFKYDANPATTTYYRVKITVSGCVTRSSIATVTVNTVPTITATTPGSRCGTGSVALGATASGGMINWYAASSGGSSLGTGVTFNTPSISSTTTYYVGSINGSCASPRTAVTATVNTIPTATISAGGATSFCTGCSVVLTSSAGSSYNWSTGATTQAITVSTTGSYTVTVTAANGCQKTSTATAVTVSPCASHTWTGSAGSSWATAASWNKCSVPGTSDDVTIPDVTTDPVISASANCRDLTINAGGSLTLNNGITLNIYRNFTNNGSYSGNGTTVLRGSIAQSVTGATSFNHLTLNNAAGATLNDPVNVNGILTLTSGTLISGGNLTVNLNTGAIAGTGTGSITGDITVSKSVNSNRYHEISSPLSGRTVADWHDDVPISPGPQYLNLYKYNETSTDTNRSTGWEPITTLSAPLEHMTGYALYFRSPVTMDLTGPYTHSATYSKSGLTNTVSSTNGTPKPDADGWQLVGNPFPSAIDWMAASGWTKTNLDDAIYFWDAVNSRYAAFVNGAGNNGATRYIPSMQAFWVKVNVGGGTGALSMNNNVRTSISNPAIWRTASSENLLRLTAGNGSYSDETIVRFMEDAEEGFDSHADAYKMMSSDNTPSFYTLLGNKKYSINSLPLIESEYILPLKLKAAFDGAYTIKADNMESFGSQDEIILEDRLSGIRQDLRINPAYMTDIIAEDTAGRFYLIFRKASVTGNTASHTSSPAIRIISAGQNVKVLFSKIPQGKTVVVISNLLGQEMMTLENVEINSHEWNMPLSSLRPGMYLVNIVTPENAASGKVYLE